MKKYKRSLVRLFVILFSTFLFFKLIMSFKQENSINKLTKSTKLVNQETVKLEENQIFVPVYGTLQSLEQISIVSQASGVLIGDNFKMFRQLWHFVYGGMFSRLFGEGLREKYL